jgi:glutamyl-tRNA synthetase
MTIRTRFAPSPTGQLHLGNIRTAIFAWAYARRHGGQFVLRIEDTDLERSTDAFKEGILRDVAWLGLEWDEGPIYQMQRMDRYRSVLADWLADGRAYHCYMPPAELDALREGQRARGEKPRYDGRWRPENRARLGLVPPVDGKPVIRFRNPDAGLVAWDDVVKGRIEIDNQELDDLIIARPDGTPTYNFCVVIDDVDMAITHVLRGDDHVNNTPRQINMFRALGAPLPIFGHTPTVLGPDGEKLSKRHGATSLAEYAEQGYLPVTLLNYLARLGWSHGDDEIFTAKELVEWFNLEGISASPGRFNPEKLAWLNQEHMKRASPEALGAALAPFLARRGVSVGDSPTRLADIAAIFRDRVHTLVELAQQAEFLIAQPPIPSELATGHLNEAGRKALESAVAALTNCEWNPSAIGAALKAAVAQMGVKMPQMMMPIRVALAGRTNTPSVDAVLALMSRDEVLARLRAAGDAATLG